MHRQIVLTSLLLLALAACKGNDEAPPATAPEGSAPAAESGAPAEGGSPMAPLSSSGQAIPQAGAPGETAGASGGIDFDLPAGWTSEPPQSNMRLAQATFQGPGGPGQLAVFYFGPGGGGGVDANIERWIGQVDVAPGTTPTPETFEANGYKVTMIDVRGTLMPSGMGMGPSTPQPDSRLLGAVVEGPGGPWFFKATGPEATLGPQREAFLAMLRSVRAG